MNIYKLKMKKILSVQENVDAEKIGIIGICGWGGMALNVASIKPLFNERKIYKVWIKR